MTKIKITNNYSYLETEHREIVVKLWKCLRFQALNYFHSRAYRQKIWDGYNEFFKKDNGKFLTGLLPEVTTALKVWGHEYEIEDQRTKVDFLHKEIDKNFLDPWTPKGEDKLELYDYQVEIINQALKHHRGIAMAPTGGGKTNIMLGFLKCIPENVPTLILANKKSLVAQNYDILEKWNFPKIGRLYDKYQEPNMITCATVQSLHKIAKHLPKIKVLIVDEIHDMMSKIPKKFYEKMTACYARLAVSATPFKFGEKDKCQKYEVKGYFGGTFKVKDAGDEKGILKTKKLQERGILSKSHCTFFHVTEPDLPHHIFLDAVTEGIAENWHFHNMILKLSKQLTGRTLILVERLAHGDTLHNLIPNSLWVAGKDNIETRKHVIQQLQKTNINENVIGIATQGIFNAGIDVHVHNLINAAGGKADHIIIQRMGRGLRSAKDKAQLNYYDFIFEINDYLKSHSKKRIKILEAEGHEIEIVKDFPY